MASIFRRGRTWWVHYLVGGKSVQRSLKTTCERTALDKKKKLDSQFFRLTQLKLKKPPKPKQETAEATSAL